MNESVQKVKQNIDWKIVTSTVVATLIVGAMVYGARKAGLGTVATVVKGG